MGDPKKPGWGRKEIPALMENVEVLAAEGDNKTAAEYANGLAQKLLPNIETNPRLKEIYLQCYYLMVENVYRQAVKLKDKAPAKYAEGRQDGGEPGGRPGQEAARLRQRRHARPLPRPDGPAEPDLKTAFLDAYLAAVEGMDKQAAAIAGRGASASERRIRTRRRWSWSWKGCGRTTAATRPRAA